MTNRNGNERWLNGLDFADAGLVLSGDVIRRRDDRFDYGETRWITVGDLGSKIVVLVWTERGQARRIISMRMANDRERDEYYRSLD